MCAIIFIGMKKPAGGKGTVVSKVFLTEFKMVYERRYNIKCPSCGSIAVAIDYNPLWIVCLTCFARVSVSVSTKRMLEIANKYPHVIKQVDNLEMLHLILKAHAEKVTPPTKKLIEARLFIIA